MQRWVWCLTVGLLVGCQMGEPPVPPAPPMPEDLSTWTLPVLAQPDREPPLPERQRQSKTPAGPAEKVVEYSPGVVVDLPVALGVPLDIALEPGEQVRQIVDGDRAPTEQGQTRRWDVKEGGEGSGAEVRPHIFVTVSEVGLTNGVTVTTTRRAYYLALKSVPKSPVRVVRWWYATPIPAMPERDSAPRLLPLPEQPRRYHVGYTVASPSGPLPTWAPRQIVDDGQKLFLIYPEVILFETVPLVRIRGPQGPQLVNVRQVLNVVIVDQLAPVVELRVGTGDQAQVVVMTRGADLRTITCPADGPDCPQWPAAAAQLGGGRP